jgi:hypothetical protein
MRGIRVPCIPSRPKERVGAVCIRDALLQKLAPRVSATSLNTASGTIAESPRGTPRLCGMLFSPYTFFFSGRQLRLLESRSLVQQPQLPFSMHPRCGRLRRPAHGFGTGRHVA